MEERKERGRGSSCYIQRGKRACSCEIACAKRCVEFLFSDTRSSRDVLGLRCAFDHPTTRIATEMMMNNVIRKNGREHLVANYLRIIPRRRYVTHTHTHTYTHMYRRVAYLETRDAAILVIIESKKLRWWNVCSTRESNRCIPFFRGRDEAYDARSWNGRSRRAFTRLPNVT